MPIFVVCDECQRSYRVRDERKGTTLKCKQCGAAVPVPVPVRKKRPSEAEAPVPPPLPESDKPAGRFRMSTWVSLGGLAVGIIALAIAIVSSKLEQSDSPESKAVNVNGLARAVINLAPAKPSPEVPAAAAPAEPKMEVRAAADPVAKNDEAPPAAVVAPPVAVQLNPPEFKIDHANDPGQPADDAPANAAPAPTSEATTANVGGNTSPAIWPVPSAQSPDAATAAKSPTPDEVPVVPVPKEDEAPPKADAAPEKAIGFQRPKLKVQIPGQPANDVPANFAVVPVDPPANDAAPPKRPPKVDETFGIAQDVWHLEADPRAAADDWEVAKNLNILLPKMSSRVLHSPGPNRFVAVTGQQQQDHTAILWDLSTGKQAGQIPDGVIAQGEIGNFALSGDGQYLANSIWERHSSPVVEVCSFRTGKVVRRMQFEDPYGVVSLLHFTAPERLFIIASTRTKYEGTPADSRQYARAWDIATGEKASEVALPDNWHPHTPPSGSCAISPGGRYLFEATTDGDFVAFDMKAMKAVGRLNIKRFTGTRSFSSRPSAFSPDGKKLALFEDGLTETRLVILDALTGNVLQKINQSPEVWKTSELDRYSGTGDFVWTNDGNGWLLRGAVLVDAQSERAVWLFRRGDGPNMEMALCTPIAVDNGFIFSFGDILESTKLGVLKMPWDDIRSTVRAIDAKGKGAKPKSIVKLQIEDSKTVSFSRQIRAALKEKLTAKLGEAGIEVVASAPATFVVKPTEDEITASVTLEKSGKVIWSGGKKYRVPEAMLNETNGSRLVVGNDQFAGVPDFATLQLLDETLEDFPLPKSIPTSGNKIALPGTTKVPD